MAEFSTWEILAGKLHLRNLTHVSLIYKQLILRLKRFWIPKKI